MRTLILLPLLLATTPALARDCKLDGVDINPDNGSYYAGKSGRIKCYDEAGELISEEEVRDGEIFGYERRKGFDGGWRERTTNANRNTHGVAKEFWPDGTLKSEGTYDDGDLVGVFRSFHKNGKPSLVSHSGGAKLEYDAGGRLKWLTCSSRSLLAEDRKPCGFAGETTTTLHLSGDKQLRVTYREGKPTAQEEVAAGGATTATSRLEDGAEVRRSFHPNGKPASELRVVDGFRVEEREWFMNGKLKSHTVREPAERDARSETTVYRDDGTKASVEIARGRNRVSQSLFDEAGRLKQTEDFAAEGHLERRRKFAPGGAVVSDESFYPDGSRKE